MKEKCIKISNEKIKSLSLEDFGKNVIESIVINYSLSEIPSSPFVSFVTDNELDNIFVIIKSKDKLMIDCFGDVIAYCNLYFGTTRGTVIIESSVINSNAVVYTVILY